MIRRKVYDILRLSPRERAGLAAEVHPIVRQISPSETLDDLVADYNGTYSAMVMATYTDGAIAAGYARYKIARLKSCDVVRLDVTVRPEYYGRIPFARFFLWELLRRRQVRPFYGLFLCASPATYHLLARACSEARESRCDAQLREIVAVSGLRPVLGRSGVVKLWPRGFHETAEEREAWRDHPSPFVKSYLKRCPDYATGEALAVLVRITPMTVIRTAARFALQRLMKALGLRRNFRAGRLGSAPGVAGAPSE